MLQGLELSGFTGKMYSYVQEFSESSSTRAAAQKSAQMAKTGAQRLEIHCLIQI